MQLPTLVLCLKPVKTQFKYKYNATKKHEYTTRQHPATTVLTNTPLQHPATTPRYNGIHRNSATTAYTNLTSSNKSQAGSVIARYILPGLK